MNLPLQLSAIADEIKLIALELKEECPPMESARRKLAATLDKSANKLEKIVHSTAKPNYALSQNARLHQQRNGR